MCFLVGAFFEAQLSVSSGSVLRFSSWILYPWSLHPEQNGRCKGLEGSVPAEPEAVPTAEPSRKSTVASLSDKLRSPAPRDPSRKRKPRGGTLRVSGWGCAARTLEPLAYTRANFSWILLPYTRVNSPNRCYPRVAIFQKLRSLAQSKAKPKQSLIPQSLLS